MSRISHPIIPPNNLPGLLDQEEFAVAMQLVEDVKAGGTRISSYIGH